MKHKTNKYFFDKYESLCRDSKLDFSAKTTVFNKTIDQMLATYKNDPYLSSLDKKELEIKIKILKAFNPDINFSDLDAICTIKHAILYTFLKLQPDFL